MTIDFRHREFILPSALTVAALATLAGTLVYMLLVPPPNAAGVVRGRERSHRQLEEEITRAKTRIARAEAVAQRRLYTGDPDMVMAEVLAAMTARASKSRLQVAAFRPMRPRSLGALTELPCSLQVSGSFPAVLTFLGGISGAETRVALRSVQLAGTEDAANTVTANLGLSVYVAAPLEAKEGSRG